jgi:hypothetical protein
MASKLFMAPSYNKIIYNPTFQLIPAVHIRMTTMNLLFIFDDGGKRKVAEGQRTYTTIFSRQCYLF